MRSVVPTSDLPGFHEFFAGSGLVAQALDGLFDPIWSNDIDAKKQAVYVANHGSNHFHLGDITAVKGADLPRATLSWASFPCQDLSLAGPQGGIHASRSGLIWQWLRILDEQVEKPPVVALENVLGFVSADDGAHYREAHRALTKRGYRCGAVMLDAVRWIPQSRPRVFVVGARGDVAIPSSLVADGPTWAHHRAVIRAATGLDDFIWWKLPAPKARRNVLADLIEWDAPVDDHATAKKRLKMIAPQHQTKLLQELNNGFKVAPGYKRTRHGEQVMELRFDGVAGCLRTPEGGSSRQFLVLRREGKLHTRLVTARETARLMGVPDSYKLVGSYNDVYKAMGDAVAVPAVAWLGKHLLRPLVDAAQVPVS